MKRYLEFWARINEIKTADPDIARRGKLLNILLVGTFVLSLLAFLSFIAIVNAHGSWNKPGNLSLVMGTGISVIGSLGLFAVNKQSPRVAAALFLLLLTLVLIFSDVPAEISNGRSSFVLFIPMVISSLLLSPASSFLFAIGNTIIVFLLADIAGVSPNYPTIIGFYMLALVAWLSSRSLEQALKDLREINTNLDKLVEQKTSELASALSRELVLAGRNQAILNSIADGVIVFDSSNVAILANPALSGLTDTPLPNLMGMRFTDLIDTARLSAAHRGTLMGLIENPERTVPGFRIEWGKRTLSTSIARVQDQAGENIGTVAVFRDISREAELEKMKDTFVAIVSHELRTPLSAILGLAEMMKESVYGPLNEKQLSIAERILVNVRRLLGMVGDLLDEAQIRAGKLSIKLQVFKATSLLDTLHHTLDKIASDKGLYLTDELDPDMPENLKGDPHRLQQVLINLVNNSIKFTEKGGIHVHIFRSEPNCWSMEVTDTGVGIPQSEMPYIFDTFRQVDNVTTRKQGGFGLGLSIVKQLVELMGGNIHVRSEEGIGSVFTATLPLEVR